MPCGDAKKEMGRRGWLTDALWGGIAVLSKPCEHAIQMSIVKF